MIRSPRPWMRPLLYSAALIVLTSAWYMPEILRQNDFRTDDYYLLTLVAEHGVVFPFDGQNYGYYSAFRILPMLSFLLDYQLYGSAPLGYYFTNLAIHNAAAVVLFLLFAEVFRRWRHETAYLLPFLLALIAAVHADLFYNVLWISNRTESLLLLFHLLAVLSVLRFMAVGRWGWYALSLLTTLLALLSKEQALHLPLLYLLLAVIYWRGGKNAVPLPRLLVSSLPFFLLAAGFFILRLVYDPATNLMISSLGMKKLFSSVGILLLSLQPSLAGPLFDYFISHRVIAAVIAALLLLGVVVLFLRSTPNRRNVMLAFAALLIVIMVPRVLYHVLPRINSIQVVFLLLVMGWLLSGRKRRIVVPLLLVWLVVHLVSVRVMLPRWRHETSNDRYLTLLDAERHTGPKRYCLVTWYHNFDPYAMHFHRYGRFGEDTTMVRSPLFIDRRYGAASGPEFDIRREDGGWTLTSTDSRTVFITDQDIPDCAGLDIRLLDRAADYGYQSVRVTLRHPPDSVSFILMRDYAYEAMPGGGE